MKELHFPSRKRVHGENLSRGAEIEIEYVYLLLPQLDLSPSCDVIISPLELFHFQLSVVVCDCCTSRWESMTMHLQIFKMSWKVLHLVFQNVRLLTFNIGLNVRCIDIKPVPLHTQQSVGCFIMLFFVLITLLWMFCSALHSPALSSFGDDNTIKDLSKQLTDDAKLKTTPGVFRRKGILLIFVLFISVSY